MPLFQGFRPVAGTICPSRAAAVVGPSRAPQGMKKGRRPRRRPRLKLSDKAGPDQCPVPGENALFPAQIAGFLAVSRPVPVYPVFLNYVVPVHQTTMSKDRYPPFSIWGILFCFSSIIFLTQKDPCRSHFCERQRPSTTYDLIRSGEMGQRSHSTGSVSPFRFLTTPGVPDAAFSCSIRRRTASMMYSVTLFPSFWAAT